MGRKSNIVYTEEGEIFKTLLNGPGILIQKITTRNPDDDQIEVAIDSMQYAIQLNEG